MTQVEITNFQSIKHLIFEFEGFSTIVGPNYIGKSALLRAINAALTNRAGVDFIRWGESFCEVKIKRPGLDLLWHKEEGHNFYVINKQRYDKIGRGEVPPILETLRYNPVKIGTEKLDLLYADQFNPLCMVDRRGSASTDLLTSIYKLDQIYKAKELCDKDLKTNKGLIGFKEKDLAFSEKDIQRMLPFPSIKDKFGNINSKKKEIESLEADINTLRLFIQKASELEARHNKLKEVERVILPVEENVFKAKEELSMVWSFKTRLETQTAKVTRLQFIKHLPDISVKPVEQVFLSINEIKKFLENLSLVASKVRKLSSVNSIEVESLGKDLDAYPKIINSLNTFKDKILALSTSIRSLSPIKELGINKIPDLDLGLISKLNSYQEGMKTRVAEITNLRSSLASTNTDIGKVSNSLEEYPNCPACGAQVDHVH